MEHPAYRPDQAPSHYNPFPAMKQDLGSHKPIMIRWNSYYMMTGYTGCNFYQQEIEKHVP
jgi:hypothetical protein